MKGRSGDSARPRCARTSSAGTSARRSSSDSISIVFSSCEVRNPSKKCTLATRVPFVHFFDGFRTSHELNTIEMLSDDDLRALVPAELVRAHRGRALSPERPFIRGTAQNPDVYFQARETVNPFYAAV